MLVGFVVWQRWRCLVVLECLGQHLLDFSKVKARDCMIPRTEIVSVDVEDSIEELSKLFISTGLSKIIVYLCYQALQDELLEQLMC